MRAVVVGVDGSDDSMAALRWALRYAGERDAVTRVVHVWTPLPWFDELPAHHRDRLSMDRARSAADAAARIEHALRDVDPMPAGVEASVVEGAPGAALVALSQDAMLLVVGATGRDGATGVAAPRVGATARYVTRHARCPVTVVGRHRPTVPTDVLTVRTVSVRIPVSTA
jgi:nucleotide-binding universal stress UspA family protein